MQKIHNFKTTVLIRECNKRPVAVVPTYYTKVFCSVMCMNLRVTTKYVILLALQRKTRLWCDGVRVLTFVCLSFDTLRNKLINFYESCMNFMQLSSSWSSLFLTCIKGCSYITFVYLVRNKHFDDANFLLTLVCVTSFMCTEYILHTLSVLQHVSAHHTCHHQGVCVGVIVMLSSGLLCTS